MRIRQQLINLAESNVVESKVNDKIKRILKRTLKEHHNLDYVFHFAGVGRTNSCSTTIFMSSSHGK